MAFESCDVFLYKERFHHIKERHVQLDVHPRASKFKSNFHLVSCLARLTKSTWQDSETYEIIEEGFKRGHDHHYMYVFKLPKVIGVDPWRFPSKEICIYDSWKPNSMRDSISSRRTPFQGVITTS